MLKIDDIPPDLFKQIAFEPNTGCWLWMGEMSWDGYGRVRRRGPGYRAGRAHRVFWMLASGPIPADKPVVRHKCDTPLCVNPEHLEIGTPADNVVDMVLKGRGRGATGELRGERNGNAKLTEAQVLAIRRVYATGKYSQAQIGRVLGVGQTTISRIVTSGGWGHVLPDE